MKASHYLADYVDTLQKILDQLNGTNERLTERVDEQATIIGTYRKQRDDLYGEIASLKAENKKLDEMLAGALL
jgi:peptidoglycan hydrolase CwlO-like protein